MKKSNLKSLIREVIYESLFGTRVNLLVGNKAKLPALISRNTRAGEEPYRFTWFVKGKEGLQPGGHLQLDKEEMDTLLTTKKFLRQHEHDLQRNFLIGSIPMSIELSPRLAESIESDIIKWCIKNNQLD